MVKNYISAKEARTQTETAQKPLNVLFKLIKEQAEWGACSVDFGVWEHDYKVVANIVDTLVQAGYSVTEQTNDDGRLTSLLVKW